MHNQLKNLARYIIRASFSQERLSYIREDSKVIYNSKDKANTKEFEAVDFIASICSHIPNKNEQMVRYMGYYSNVCRGRRKKQETAQSDFVIEDCEHNKGLNKSWAHLKSDNSFRLISWQISYLYLGDPKVLINYIVI